MADEPDTDAPDEGTGDEFDVERAKAKIAKTNSENASLRKRLKAAEEKAAKLDEIEQADKSEADQLRDQLAEAQRQAQEAQRRHDRLEVALEKALPEKDAKRVLNGSRRLVGDDRDALEADAEDYFASFGPLEGDPPANRSESLPRGGGDPTSEPDVDVKSIVDSIPPI